MFKQEIALCKASFYYFFKKAWPHIEGSKVYQDSWHIEAMCEHIQALYERKIRNLIINVPPRSCKSNVASVVFPAWVWLQDAEESFMYASFSMELSRRFSTLTRTLVTSDWYRSLTKGTFALKRGENRKNYIENTRGGYRISTSAGAKPLGRGASFLICDDPNGKDDVVSQSDRNAIKEWWSQEFYNRLNPGQEGCRLVTQQRLNAEDLTGIIKSSAYRDEWVEFILPMEFEESRKCSTIILPSTNGKVWTDPRTKEGELLTPGLFSAKDAIIYKKAIGEYGYAGKYQQRPSPKEGGILKDHYFKWWKSLTFPELFMRVQSWDTALTANDKSSWSACTTWGLFRNEHNQLNVILLGMWRGKLEYPELRKLAKRLYFDYTDDGDIPKIRPKQRDIDICLVEAKASGSPLIQDLNRFGIKATSFIPDPKKHGDKISRVKLIAPLIESGLVYLPAMPSVEEEGSKPVFNNLYSFAEKFVEHIKLFPNHDSQDIVDTMTQTLIYLKSGQYIKNPYEEYLEETPVERKKIY